MRTVHNDTNICHNIINEKILLTIVLIVGKISKKMYNFEMRVKTVKISTVDRHDSNSFRHMILMRVKPMTFCFPEENIDL